MKFQSTAQQIFRWKDTDLTPGKIDYELILEANILQLIKQDLDKTPTALLRNDISTKASVQVHPEMKVFLFFSVKLKINLTLRICSVKTLKLRNLILVIVILSKDPFFPVEKRYNLIEK